MKLHKVHLRSVADSASCGEVEVCFNIADDHALVTCKFCLSILRLRLTRHNRAFTTQEWTLCHVTVTSDLEKGKRYRAQEHDHAGAAVRRLRVEHHQVGDIVFVLVEDGYAGARGRYTVYRARCGRRPTRVGLELRLREARLLARGLWP